MGVIIEEIVDDQDVESHPTGRDHRRSSRVAGAYTQPTDKGTNDLSVECQATERDKISSGTQAGVASKEEEGDRVVQEEQPGDCDDDSRNPRMYYSQEYGSQNDTEEGEEEEEEEELSEEEKRERCTHAETYKKQGNEWYRSGNYKEAIEMYTKALETAPLAGGKRTRRGKGPGERSSSDESVDDIARLRCIYFSNRAACHLALEEYEDAIEDCSNAVDLDPRYIKAYMRRATCFEHIKEYDRGLDDASYIIKSLDANNAFAVSYVSRITPVAEKRREELKDEMMGKLKDLGNSILGNFGLSLDNFKAEQDPTTGSYSIKFSQDS